MGRQATADFVVDTIGHCFFCMEEMSPQQLHSTSSLAQPGSSSSSSIYSMLYLSRYLKIKMRKVFNENVPIPEYLLRKVEMSTLKVSLCEECASWNSRLSELLRKLEKIEIEAASYLQLIHGKLQGATQDGKSEKLVDCCSTDSELMGKLEVADALRNETMERCSQKMNGPQLKIKLQNMSERDIENLKQPKSNVETCNATEYESDLNDVKLETSNTEGMWEGSETGYLEDFEVQNEDSTQGNISTIGMVKTQSGPGSPPEIKSSSSKLQKNYLRKSQIEEYNSGSKATKVRMNLNLKQNYVKNSRTGKYDCKLCVKTFASVGGFYTHFKSSHRKIGFKCKICNKEFTQQGSLKTHQNSVHLKLRVNCQFCNKSFTCPNNRYDHIRLKKCKMMKNRSSTSQQQDYPQPLYDEHLDTNAENYIKKERN